MAWQGETKQAYRLRDKLLKTPFIDLPEICEKIKDKETLVQMLEALSVKAGMMAA